MTISAQPADWDRPEWLAWRRQGIGGSDVAGLLGLSRYSSPLSLYFDKIGELPEREAGEAARWGQLLEEPIAREFEVRTGLYVVGAQALAVDDEHPHRRATLDGLVTESGIIPEVGPERAVDAAEFLGSLQIKTARSYGWDGVPLEYAVQVQWELAVARLERAWLAVLFAGQRLELIPIEADLDTQAALARVVDRFWTEHVEPRREPPADSAPATTDALKAVYPDHRVEDVIELAPEVLEAAEELVLAKAAAKDADERVDRLENTLKAALKEHRAGGRRRDDGELEALVTWKTENAGDRLDAKALREAHPRIAARFTNPSTRRVLRLSKTLTQGATK